jgi:hypothetical protein
MSYPYSYTRCQAHLELLERRQLPHLRRELLTNTVVSSVQFSFVIIMKRGKLFVTFVVLIPPNGNLFSVPFWIIRRCKIQFHYEHNYMPP